MTSATDSMDAAMAEARRMARPLAEAEAADTEAWIASVLDPAGIGSVDWRITTVADGRRVANRCATLDYVKSMPAADRKRLASSRWGHLSSVLPSCSVEDFTEAAEAAGTDAPTVIGAMLRVLGLRVRGGHSTETDRVAADVLAEAAWWADREEAEAAPTEADELDGAWWAAVLADAARADVATVEDVPDVPDVPAPAPTVADADTIGEWSNTPDGWRVILDDPGGTLAPGRYRVRRSRKSPRWADVRPDGAGRMVRS